MYTKHLVIQNYGTHVPNKQGVWYNRPGFGKSEKNKNKNNK